MRLSLVLVGLCAASAASARPRAQVTFAAGKGGEAVAYFAPEVARTVAERLEAAGVEPAADVAVAGHIDELPGERVRLTASVHGHTVSVEGSIENLDGVAAQLASRLVPLVGESAAHKPVAGHKPTEIAAAPATEKKSTDDRSSTEIASASAAVAVGKPPASTEKPVAEKSAEKPAAEKSAAEKAPAERPAASSDPTTSVIAPIAGDPPSSSAPMSATAPIASAPQPPPSPFPGYRPPPQIGGFPRAQPVVVAHAVPDSPSAFAGNGISATQALYYFLGKRLGLLVVRGGIGLAPPQIAAAEAWRAQARSVVMAHIEAVDYTQTQAGPGLRCRLEVMVVRDGRVVLRRVVESPPAAASPSPGRRGRELDPMFVAVSQALEALGPELAPAIVDAR